MHAPASTPLRFALFCRVVDNFGDAGVCWRLARQLAREHGADVTLWIDGLDALRAIEPDAAHDRRVRDVLIRAWPDATDTTDAPASKNAPHRHDAPCAAPFADMPAHVIVSAFGCTLPAPVRAALAPGAARGGLPPPLWVNLEYLSAEAWVEGCHGLRSVKPDDGAVEHFFYPGFTPATGGLLREHDLFATRDDFLAREAVRWLNDPELLPAPGERLVSLFCYREAALDGWLRALGESPRPTRVLVPTGVAELAMLRVFKGRLGTQAGARATLGTLTVQRIPWMPQDDYDRLLWCCDLNVVRGEDSWIRAHWAGRPFLWQPYPQPDHAHFAKLDAFLTRFAQATGAPTPARELMYALAGRGDAHAAARRYDTVLDSLRTAHRQWTAHLAAHTDLASALVGFCHDRL